MIDVSFSSLFATDGFYKILTAAFVAGVVHGFSGFGSAMVFLPVAGQFLLPIFALTALTVMDASGPLSAVPKALRDGCKLDLLRLVVAMILVVPAALWLLTHTDPAVFRYLVSIMALVLLTTVLIGLRYRVICARACFMALVRCQVRAVDFLGCQVHL